MQILIQTVISSSLNEEAQQLSQFEFIPQFHSFTNTDCLITTKMKAALSNDKIKMNTSLKIFKPESSILNHYF